MCVCVVGALDFFCFISFLFCLPEIKIFVFVVLDLTAQPFFFGLAHKKTKLCSLPVCAFFLSSFFSKNIHLKCFFSFFVNTKKNICLFCPSSDFLFVQLTDFCVCVCVCVESSFLSFLFFSSSSCFCLFVCQRKK